MTTSCSIGTPGCRDKVSLTSFAYVPRVTSLVLGPPESSRSRTLIAHAGLEIRQPPCYITVTRGRRRHRGESAT